MSLASETQIKSSADALPEKFKFDPKDEFYLAPPMCKLLHYREGAILAGILEICCLTAGVFAFTNLHSDRGLTELWTLLIMIFLLVIGCVTTGIMLFGIYLENPKLMIPQITFLHIEIVLLLFGSVGSIASMSLGIEWTHKIFSPFVSVPEMETHFGPIWPFNVAIICFSGAAFGIWFHLTVQGCQDFLLDKIYFREHNDDLPMELRNKIEAEQQVASTSGSQTN
ncbi:hypothetical protein M3Y94_00601400 [Aphelenchoides besseyi]|nr:hypothetical protein M3Y94_00601400 [Aphelenchoides besseyi]KAI6222223.1 hypothetical protein M3Y95_00962000 [Aphelenchoides besseyi]